MADTCDPPRIEARTESGLRSSPLRHVGAAGS